MARTTAIRVHVSTDQAASAFISKEAEIVAGCREAWIEFTMRLEQARGLMLLALTCATIIQAKWTTDPPNMLGNLVLLLMTGAILFNGLPVITNLLAWGRYCLKRAWLVRRGIIIQLKG